MQIHVVWRRGPFISRKGRELARLIVLVGNCNGLFPDAAGHLGVEKFADRLAPEHGGAKEKINFLNVVLAVNLQFLGNRQLAYRGVRVIGQPDGAYVFGVIGHCLEVERALQLDRETTRMLDRLASAYLYASSGPVMVVPNT